jgi:outer membrane protein
MNTVKGIVLAVSSALFVLPMAASAYDKGDIVVKFGAASVSPASSSDEISPDLSVTADDEVQLGISGTYMVSDKLGLELLAATPFSHELTFKGTSAKVGSIKHLPPTLSAQYYFMGSKSKFKPYVGAGVNYTVFFDEEVGSAVSDAYSDLDLDDSVGLSAQVGFDYQINNKWMLNASAMYIDINTTATLSGDDIEDLEVDYDLDPMVYRLNVGFTF